MWLLRSGGRRITRSGCCSDGNECTTLDTCVAGACVPGANECECDISIPCPDPAGVCGQQYCNLASHSCEANPAATVVCSTTANTECQAAQCDPVDGCVMADVNEGAACDASDPCFESICESGECVAVLNACECITATDCADDADLCNGTPYCTADHTCKNNPATVISCNDAFDTACANYTCIPSTGVCAYVPINVGGACTDGVPCTENDTCDSSGSCQPGPNACECLTPADCPDPSGLCGAQYCDNSSLPYTCKTNPAATVVCPSVDNTECAAAQCDPSTGACSLVPINERGACQVGWHPCLTFMCSAGECVEAANSCECLTSGDCVDDGNLCNGTPYCDVEDGFVCVTNPATVVTCGGSGDTECAAQACEPSTGTCSAVSINEGSPCGDVTSCAQRFCQSGSCEIVDLSCDCLTDVECAAYDDGNLCNGSLRCDIGGSWQCEVERSTIVTCSDLFPADCSQSVCVEETGICLESAAPDLASCDDADPCTTTACLDGVCAVIGNEC